MPARDQNHNSVRTALERVGWVITHDPYNIGFEQDNELEEVIVQWI
jgi:hypothetical protein